MLLIKYVLPKWLCAVPVRSSVSWARYLQQFIWENLLWFPCTVYRSIVIVLYIDGEDNDLMFSCLEEVRLAAKSQLLDTNYSLLLCSIWSPHNSSSTFDFSHLQNLPLLLFWIWRSSQF